MWFASSRRTVSVFMPTPTTSRSMIIQFNQVRLFCYGECLQYSIEDVAIWMFTNRFCLNPSKTELIWLGSSRRFQHCSLDEEMILSGTTVRPVDCVRELGVLVDNGITLTNHVNKVAGVCWTPTYSSTYNCIPVSSLLGRSHL